MARHNSRKKRSTPRAQPTTLPPQQQQQPPRQETHEERAQQQEQQQAQVVADHDPFTDEFFSEPASPPVSDPWEGNLDVGWEDAEERPRIAPEKRRAMVATAVIFGAFVVLLGSFTVYSQLIMPTPVALGASAGTFTLPTPIQMEPRAEVAIPTVVSAPADEAPSEVTPVEVGVVAEDAAPVLPVAQQETRPARTAAAEHGGGPRSSARLNKQREVAAVNEPDDLGESAMRALNAGQPRDALRLAQQAVADHPERANGWIVLGAANDALGDHAAALTAYANCSARATGARVATCRALAR